MMCCPSPLVSIIVPVYNAETTLCRCIDSILAQNFDDFELILINDGSTDLSGSIIDEYEKSENRIRTYYKSNGGVSSARNFGLKNVRGSWVTFVDADDWLEEDYLSNFMKSKLDDSDLIIAPIIKVNRDRDCCLSPTPLASYMCQNSFIRDYLGHESSKFVWGKFFLYRYLICGKLFFDERMRVGEDTLFFLHYLNNVKNVTIIKDSAKSHYIYMDKINGIDFYLKYCLSVKESVSGLIAIMEAYENLNIRNYDFLRNTINVFYGLCMKDMKTNYGDWYGNNKIKCICLNRSSSCIARYIKTWFMFFLYAIARFIFLDYYKKNRR